jgi:hypothetical protein
MYYIFKAYSICSFLVRASKSEIGNKAERLSPTRSTPRWRRILPGRRPSCHEPASGATRRRFNPRPASSHCSGRRHTNLAQDQLHASSYKKVYQQYEQISSEKNLIKTDPCMLLLRFFPDD